MDAINRFFNSFPAIFQAIILLVIAFLVAWLARTIAVMILRRLHVDERLGSRGVQDSRTGSTADFVGKLVFLIVFLLFLPSVLDKLNMNSVSDPITGMIGSILHYLPNILAAALILFIGHLVARLVGQVVEALLRRLNIDRVQTRLGMTVTAQNSLATVVSKIVYALIMILVAIAALQALAISSISDPAVAMLHRVLTYIPLLIVGLVLIALGVFIGGLVGRLVTDLLAGFGADSWLAKLLPRSKRAHADSEAAAAPSFSLSTAIGTVVRVVIILLFVVEGLQVLQLDLLTRIGAAIIGYLPSALAAAVIMVLAVLAGSWVESLIVRRSPAHRSYAVAAKVAILVLAVFMTLTQLHLSQQIVTIAFLATVGAVAVAFAIAFGVGGRAFAAGRLSKLERTLDDPGPASAHVADPGTGPST